MDIKSVIKKKGFTLQQVADQWKPTPISKGALWKSVNGNPTATTLYQIATIIECNVADFFMDDYPPREQHTFTCPCCGKRITITIDAEEKPDEKPDEKRVKK